MSQLSRIVSSEHSKPGIRAVIAGNEKIGKTTLVCGAPDVLLIPLEVGYSGVSVNHIPMLESFNDFLDLLNEIGTSCAAGKFPYRTLAIDSATALERLLHDSVLSLDPLYKKGAKKTVSMESALGGYGKAFSLANERFTEMIAMLDILAVRFHLNIIFTCHTFAAKIIDPVAGEYDSWDLLLHSPKNQKTYGKREFITQWADLIGFLYEPIMVTQQNNTAKGISENRGRVLGLSRTPSYVAGNRFGMEGEISIPKEQGWNYLAHAIYQSCGIDVYKR